jgi:hypothetical protein
VVPAFCGLVAKTLGRTGIMNIEIADTLPDGWRLWRDWHLAIAPDNRKEIEALETDEGRYLAMFVW